MPNGPMYPPRMYRTGPQTGPSRANALPSYAQMQERVEQLYLACGMLFAALSPFSAPRQMVNMGGTAMYLVTEQVHLQA